MFSEGIAYICGEPHYREDGTWCKKSPTKLPKDAPQNLELSEVQVEGMTLQVNHINKDILDNDLHNLEYLCVSCHKKEDLKTEKGVSQRESEHGYEL